MKVFTIIAATLSPSLASADWETNMPIGVTPTSEIAYDIHMLIFYITVVIGILVFGAMLYSIIYHRKSIGAKPAQFHESTKVEYLEDNVSFFSKIDDESNKARQLNSGIDVNQVKNYLRNVDNIVVLPTNTKVRILLTANDVIHAWWVPELGGKKDAIPGYINELWVDIKKPGIYRGQCAELCGKDHGFMPIVVQAVSKTEYHKWVSIQQNNKVAKNK